MRKLKGFWSILSLVLLMQLPFCGCAEIHGVWEVQSRYPVEIVCHANSENDNVVSAGTIHTNRAIAEQYETDIAELILFAQGYQQNAACAWPTVMEIVQFFDESYSDEGLQELEQLTILQDIKYTENGYRVVEGDQIEETSIHQHQMRIEEYEATRFARNQDFIVIQFDLENHCIYLLDVTDYNPSSGGFTVEFPCVGPFMITQRIPQGNTAKESGGLSKEPETPGTDIPGHGSIIGLEQAKDTVIYKQNAQGEWQSPGAMDEIYTSEADENQYTGQEAELIRLAKSFIADTGHNGFGVIDDIPTVEEIVLFFNADLNIVGIRNMKQLTPLQDFKYRSSDYRVREGELSVQDETLWMQIEGSEITKAASINDFAILQFNLQSAEVYQLNMMEYAPDTGAYVIEFPCFGPYMVLLRN